MYKRQPHIGRYFFFSRATHQSQRIRSTHAGSLAQRAKHQTGRPTRAGPRTPPNVPRTSPGALPHGSPAEGRGLPQARVYHASVTARQSNADGRPNAGKEGQVVGKALSPGSPATQCVEHGSRVRMLAPVARPYEGPVRNMRVHQFRPKRRVLALFPFRPPRMRPEYASCARAHSAMWRADHFDHKPIRRVW